MWGRPVSSNGWQRSNEARRRPRRAALGSDAPTCQIGAAAQPLLQYAARQHPTRIISSGQDSRWHAGMRISP
jgi:hypothetical protein